MLGPGGQVAHTGAEPMTGASSENMGRGEVGLTLHCVGIGPRNGVASSIVDGVPGLLVSSGRR